jgi:hypothetical protein
MATDSSVALGGQTEARFLLDSTKQDEFGDHQRKPAGRKPISVRS